MTLSDRIEQLSGPDREVDAEIALSLGIVTERDGNCFYGHHYHSVMVLERSYHGIEAISPELPAFTASFDAAMMLVPEGWVLDHLTERNAPDPQWQWKAQLWQPRTDVEVVGRALKAGGHKSAPALALCAAALRAKGL